MAYRSPAPGAQVGRTDEGVDFGTTPGSAIRAIGAGVIEFVGRYSGFGTYIVERLTSGPAAGQDVYYAEEQSSVVRPRQRVAAGQKLGVASSSLEVGFAQRGGGYLPQAQAEGGYFEGQVTNAGRRFRSLLFGGPGQPATSSSPSSNLEQLWIDAGGKPGLARIMAAIALAESGGRVDATHRNSDGSIDRGLWQINSSHTAFAPDRLLSEPLYNAKAAVSIEKSQGLGAWTTYTSGAYLDYLGRAPGARTSSAPITRPGGAEPDPGEAQNVSWRHYLDPNPWPYLRDWLPLSTFSDAAGAVSDVGSFLKWIAWLFHPRNLLRMVEFLTGAGLIGLGLWMSVKDAESSTPSSGPRKLGLVTRTFEASPPGRAVRLQRARRQGRSVARNQRRLSESRKESDRARRREDARLAGREQGRQAKRTPADEIPF